MQRNDKQYQVQLQFTWNWNQTKVLRANIIYLFFFFINSIRTYSQFKILIEMELDIDMEDWREIQRSEKWKVLVLSRRKWVETKIGFLSSIKFYLWIVKREQRKATTTTTTTKLMEEKQNRQLLENQTTFIKCKCLQLVTFNVHFQVVYNFLWRSFVLYVCHRPCLLSFSKNQKPDASSFLFQRWKYELFIHWIKCVDIKFNLS